MLCVMFVTWKSFMRILVIANLLLLTASSLLEDGPKYINIHVHEILENQVYLSITEFGEIIVTFSGKEVDLKTNDLITHADGIRILSGGLVDFLKSAESEVMVGGSRLTGFVKLTSAKPRKLSSRRGDIVFDMNEGGPAPAMNLGKPKNWWLAFLNFHTHSQNRKHCDRWRRQRKVDFRSIV